MKRNMTSNRLHPLAVKQAKPKNKKYRLLDGDSLFCEILPTGRKVWRINYIFNHKPKTYTIGRFPEISLSDARKQRDELSGLDNLFMSLYATARLEMLSLQQNVNKFALKSKLYINAIQHAFKQLGLTHCRMA
jgi:hypothetical protein